MNGCDCMLLFPANIVTEVDFPVYFFSEMIPSSEGWFVDLAFMEEVHGGFLCGRFLWKIWGLRSLEEFGRRDA